MTIDELREALNGLPPEKREAIMADLFADYETEGQVIGEQTDRANRLRETPTPEGRKYGRFYTSASPLEHLGALGQRGVGEYKARKAEQRRERMGDRRSGALRGLAGAMAGMGAPAAPAAPAAFASAPAGPSQQQQMQAMALRGGQVPWT